jgi:biopolymer transport protein TolR
MEMGKVGDVRSEINVTPLVDVCLVLLIIFILVQPLTQMGYDVKVPPPAPPTLEAPPPDQMVVSMTEDKKIFFNKQELSKTALVQQLSQILANRRDKVVFFSVEDKVNYGEAVDVMDAVRNAPGHEEKVEAGVKIGIVMEPVPVR